MKFNLLSIIVLTIVMFGYNTWAADEAWVLWQRDHTPSTPNIKNTDWTVHSGFRSYEECVNEPISIGAEYRVVIAKPLLPVTSKVKIVQHSQSYISVFFDDGQDAIHRALKCLPVGTIPN